MSKYSSHETLPYFRYNGSLIVNCYYHQDLHQTPLQPPLRESLRRDVRACLLDAASHLLRRLSVGSRFQRHPFSGLRYSAGKFLHTS